MTESTQNKVIHKMKLVRLSQKVRKNKIESKKKIKIRGVMFDERKDMCLNKITSGQIRTKKIENCSIVVFGEKRKDVKSLQEGSEPQEKNNNEEESECFTNKLFHIDDEIDYENSVSGVMGMELDGNSNKNVKVLKDIESDEFLDKFVLTEKEKTGEDQGEYIGHGQPKKGTGRSVAECVLEHLKKYEANTSELKVVFTDLFILFI